MEVVFERGGLSRLSAHLSPWGARRVLLLTSSTRRFVEPALGALGGLEVHVFDQARVHVPADTVAAARAALDAHAADALVALGGGSAIGLGKALCLEREQRWLAVPTTYAGSEMTNVYGVTEAGRKRTGRDDRVRPATVLYDAELSAAMPLPLTIQSLCNSLAQILSALSTASVPLDEADAWVFELWDLMGALTDAPTDLPLRERALRAASAAGGVLDRGTMGLQHRLAHRIGGRFDLPHAAVHSALLPAFLTWLRRDQPDLMSAVDRSTGTSQLELALMQRLRNAGVPACPLELPVSPTALQALLADTGEAALPIALVEAVLAVPAQA